MMEIDSVVEPYLNTVTLYKMVIARDNGTILS